MSATVPAPEGLLAPASPVGVERGRSELALAAELAGVKPEDIRAYLEWALANNARLMLVRPVIAFRSFSQEDWWGLAGAEPFADDSEPQIAELLLDGDACSVILDGTGLSVLADDPEGRTAEFSLPFGEAPLAVSKALEALRPEMALDDLLDLGFDLVCIS